MCVCVSLYTFLWVCVCVSLSWLSPWRLSPWWQHRQVTATSHDAKRNVKLSFQAWFPWRLKIYTRTQRQTKTHGVYTPKTLSSSSRWEVCMCAGVWFCSRRAAQTLISYHISQVMVFYSTLVQRHCLTTESNTPRPDNLATQTKQTQTDNIYYTYISLKHTPSFKWKAFEWFPKKETSLIRRRILRTNLWLTMLDQRATGGPESMKSHFETELILLWCHGRTGSKGLKKVFFL